ncbi:hypothetical protein ACHAWT_005049 [Skeletonema menzelii]
MATIFTSLISSTVLYLYDYWFSPSSSMGSDMLEYLKFTCGNIACLILLCLYCLSTAVIWCIQILPLSSIVLWWPKFYATIIFDPTGRSLLQILRDPGYKSSTRDKPSRYIRRNFIAKNKTPLPVAHPSVRSLSCYTSYGVYAHLGQTQDYQAQRAIFIASNKLHCNNPLWTNSMFDYIATRIPDLPDTIVTRFFAILMVILAFAWTLGSRLLSLFIKDFNEEQQHLLDGTLFDREIEDKSPGSVDKSTSSDHRKHIALVSKKIGPRSSHTHFDTDGISYVIDNSATCVICNDESQFEPGTLRKHTSSVETANGEANPSMVGTLRLTLTADDGESFQYLIPDAIYDPNSPFNILGIPALGDFFGRNDTVPSSDDEGTFVTSSANRTILTWDHGKHQRSFAHSDKRLPELLCEAGYGYFHAFTSRLRRAFDDKVHYAFSSAHTKLVSPVATTPLPKVTPSTESPFTLGEEVIYTDGSGNSSAVVYEGGSVNGNHIIRTEHGDRIVTPAPHLKALNQPDLTNVPRTPLDYCKEIKDVTQEELKELVYPRQLSPVQQEFLSWHNRLFHMPFSQMYKLAKLGFLPKRFLKCTNMLCISCQFGKAHRRPWRTKGTTSSGIRKKTEKRPGDGTSVDQIVSAQAGLMPQMAGELTSSRIWGATVFVDHVTDYVYCHLMSALSLEETLLAKLAYEKLLAQMGHKAKHFRADNGRFADKGFMKSIEDADQTITFCGVGHHGQNGIVEHKNKMLTLGARTLLLHGIRMWPQMIDSMFWPFALKAYAEQLNCLRVDEDGQTPESKMTGIPTTDLPVANYHTLFCPVYVLDSRLQSAGGLGPPKWEPRSRIGVYCGHSPLHAGNVALVFNPRTGRVSPQFHCVFDDDFTTVPYMERGEVPPNWEDLCRHSFESAEDESVAAALNYLSSWTGTEQVQKVEEATSLDALSELAVRAVSKDPLSDPFAVSFDQQPSNLISSSTNLNHRSTSEGDDLPRQLDQPDVATLEPASKRQRKLPDDTSGQPINLMTDFDAASDTDEDQQNKLLMPVRVNLHEAGLRRSKRIQENNAKQAKAHVTFGKKCALATVSLFALLTSVPDITMPAVPSRPLPANPTRWNRIATRFEELNELCDGTLNDIHHMALATEASNETYTYAQAMRQSDRASFIVAMEKEIEDHETRKHWKLVHQFILTDEGSIDKFLGVEIVDRGKGQFEMKQPFLIDRIVRELGLKDTNFDCHVNEKKTPANTVLLNRDLDGKPRKKNWNYRQLVGMLGYLQANTRPDISMPVHQCARFCLDPKLSHEQAITRIGRYLRDTSDRGIIYTPDKSKGLEVFVDADFAGGWNKNDPHDVDSLYSRAGYVIKYAGCPIYWKSKLMNGEMALSTAEAEFMALSTALREVIPLMTMMEEINEVFPLLIDKPDFHCNVWEDNQSCIAMTRRHHFTPRTKHIALKYYHFMSHVGTRLRIKYVHTESQEADIFTKPVKDHLFFPLRVKLMGW